MDLINNNLANQLFVIIMFFIFIIFLVNVLTYEKDDMNKVIKEKPYTGIPKDEMWFQRS